MERQTLRDWVHRFNGSGPEGLIDRKAPGKLLKLNSEQKARLATVVEEGPTPSVHGVVRAPARRRRSVVVDVHRSHKG